jgi:superfamily II DNA or RNA helicase
MKVICKDGIYIPINKVSESQQEEVRKYLEKDLFQDETACERCEYFAERVCDVCESCPNYGGRLILHSTVLKGSNTYLRLPYGVRRFVNKLYDNNVTFVSKNKLTKVSAPFEFTGELRDYQKLACKETVKKLSGVLKSAPRSGKTIMGAYICAQLGYKTLIIAQQHEWLDNFKETFIGSATQKALTNIKKSKIGNARKLEDFEKYDVCLVTYQLFISPKGKELLNKIKGFFPLVIIDEVQTANANVFASVISKLEFEHCYGLSGTPQRKDSKEYIIDKLLGPIIHETVVEKLVPRIEITKTALGGAVPKTWTYLVKRIEEDPERLKLIAKTAIAEVKRGHQVLIPFTRVAVIRALTQAINIESGKKLAASFYGGQSKDERKKIIDLAREYKIKIIVGNIRLLSTGVNIPRASCLFECTPCSNGPKAEQRFSRILTPMEGKPEPVIRYFLDELSVRKTCIASEFFKTLLPMFRPKMSDSVKTQFYAYMNRKTNSVSSKEVLGGVI